MSIIYEALSKTQKNREEAAAQEPSTAIHPSNLSNTTNNKHIVFRITLFTLLLTVTASIASLIHFRKAIYDHFHPKKIVAVAAPAPKPHIKFILNGVFLAGNERVAMINNQLFHVGDTIDGMKVTYIELENVKLQDQFGSVLIPVAT